MSSVAVVTDSTAYLPAELAGRLTVVPLTIVLGDRQGLEGVEVGAAEVTEALVAGSVPVTTSRPAPIEFASVYRRLLAAGHDGVLSVHLSARLSGTVDAATVAAREFDGAVAVIDSGSVAMGLGFPALAAAEAAASGQDLSGVRRAAHAAIAATTTLFCVRTLEFLRRGGRIGAAAALLGTALSVHPILHVTGDGIAVRDRVRTAGRAQDRLAALAVEAAGESRVAIAVHHLAAPEQARAIAGVLADRLADRVRRSYLTEVGAAVGAHAGPGLVGVVVARLDAGS